MCFVIVLNHLYLDGKIEKYREADQRNRQKEPDNRVGYFPSENVENKECWIIVRRVDSGDSDSDSCGLNSKRKE